MTWADRFALAFRLAGSVFGVQQQLVIAEPGQHVETDPIGHARVFGRRVRPYVVFIVEE
jgi:hypothetical protein